MKIKRISRRFLLYLFIILIAIVMLWPQIHNHAFVSGYDYYFHMSRTYETAMQIKTGHFSYFLSLFSWDHNARIVNALYGPVGGYISGLVLLLSGSWLHWEIIMSLIALVLAGETMYSLGRYWHVNRYVNMLLSILYMQSEPVSDYVFNQMFAGFGAALLPLLVLLMSEILTRKDVQPVKFALILILIVEIHLMTFILSMVVVIPCLLAAIYSAHQTRSRLLEHLCKGVGLMLILSFNVWGTILEVFGSNFHHIIPTFPGNHLGDKAYSAILNTYPKTAFSQTPSLIGIGVTVLIAITVALWLINCHHFNYVINTLMLLGIFSIWLASGYFPWLFVKGHFSLATTLIQFPKRFLPLGLILIYLGLEIMLSKYLKYYNSRKAFKAVSLIFLLCLVGWGWHHNYETTRHYINVYSSSQVINWHHFVNMKWQKRCSSSRLRNELRANHPGRFLSQVDSPVPDYLPTNITYQRPSQYKSLNPQASYQHTYISNQHFKWMLLSHNRQLIILLSKYHQIKTLPFVKYAHTQITLNGRVIKPQVNRMGAIKLRMRPGQNHLKIQYQPSWLFRIGILISILTWLWLISTSIYRKNK